LRRWFHREQIGPAGGRLSQPFKRRDVVDDVDAAAMRANNEIVLARMNDNVMDGHGGDVVLELRPYPACIGGVERAMLGADEEEIPISWMLPYHLHR
jgi:hypothetical protein